mgnify:CR=1 FL=1
MNYDAMNTTRRSSSSRESTSASQETEKRKPFVKPELRRETDLLDGTGTTVSWSGD